MSVTESDKDFHGSIARLYESHFVPLLFAPYADDLARRIASRPVSSVLEIAAGTGVVTRALASTLPASVSIVATDLNQAMLDQGMAIGTSRPVEWRLADAMQLPFADGRFDAVVCQFGVMFFPDRARAFAEVRRVLAAGGVFLFSVWDRIEDNEFADVVTSALTALFPDDPPRFMARTPHGYFDVAQIRRDLAAGGFAGAAEVVTVTERSRAPTARDAAIAFCLGSPLGSELRARDGNRLGEALDVVTEALAARFGRGAIGGKIQAHVVGIENSVASHP
ncbi:MAG: class I SAM-dependent methyltransferase [Gemmatimonadaceae bacterium]